MSYSSTPENFERSQCPAVSDACACGMLRASASSSAIVCSAAVTTFDCGAFATTIPRRVAAGDVDVVDADAGAGDDPQPLAALDQLGRQLRRRADQDRVEAADPLGQLLGRPVEPGLDVEVLAQQRDARLAHVLADQHARAHAIRSSR